MNEPITIKDLKKAHPRECLNLFMEFCEESIDPPISDYEYDDPDYDRKPTLTPIAACAGIPALMNNSLASYIINIAKKSEARGYILRGDLRIIQKLADYYWRGDEGIFARINIMAYYLKPNAQPRNGASANVIVRHNGSLSIETVDSSMRERIETVIQKLRLNKNAILFADKIYKALRKNIHTTTETTYSFQSPTHFIILRDYEDYIGWHISPFAFCHDNFGILKAHLRTEEYVHIENLYNGLAPAKKKQLIKSLDINATSPTDWPHQIFAEVDREDFYHFYNQLIAA